MEGNGEGVCGGGCMGSLVKQREGFLRGRGGRGGWYFDSLFYILTLRSFWGLGGFFGIPFCGLSYSPNWVICSLPFSFAAKTWGCGGAWISFFLFYLFFIVLRDFVGRIMEREGPGVWRVRNFLSLSRSLSLSYISHYSVFKIFFKFFFFARSQRNRKNPASFIIWGPSTH